MDDTQFLAKSKMIGEDQMESDDYGEEGEEEEGEEKQDESFYWHVHQHQISFECVPN